MSDAPPARLPRWARIALISSLALNVAVIGLLGGLMIAARDVAVGGLPIDGFRFVAQYLPERDQRELRRRIFSNRAEVEAIRDAMKENREAFLSALRADPFDQDQAAAVMQAQADATIRFSTTARGALIAQIASLSAEERRAFADLIEEELKARRHRGGPRRQGEDRRPPRE